MDNTTKKKEEGATPPHPPSEIKESDDGSIAGNLTWAVLIICKRCRQLRYLSVDKFSNHQDGSVSLKTRDMDRVCECQEGGI